MMKGWLKMAGAVCALSLLLSGCDKVEEAAGEAEEGATATAEGAESEGSEAEGKKPEGECTIESIPFEAGAAGSGRVAFAVAADPEGKQGNRTDGGVGVLSVEDAEWVYRDTTADLFEHEIKLSANGEYVAYLVVDETKKGKAPSKYRYFEVVDLKTKEKKKYSSDEMLSEYRLYGVTDDGEPVVRFNARDENKKVERRTGAFKKSGEFEVWLSEPGAFMRGVDHGVLAGDGKTVISSKSKRGRGIGLRTFQKGQEPELFYELPKGARFRLNGGGLDVSADASRVVAVVTLKEGGESTTKTLAFELSNDKVYEHTEFRMPSLSPDGQKMLGADISDPKLMGKTLLRDFAKPSNLKTYEDNALRAWSPDSKWAIFIADQPGSPAPIIARSVESDDVVTISACHHYPGGGVAWAGE
jgi:hypothetical protein